MALIINWLSWARHAARAGAVVSVLSTVDSASHGAHAQDTVPVLVRVEDRTRVSARNRVVVQDPRTRADREIYRSEGRIPYEVATSADGRYFSFIEVVSQT